MKINHYFKIQLTFFVLIAGLLSGFTAEVSTVSVSDPVSLELNRIKTTVATIEFLDNLRDLPSPSTVGASMAPMPAMGNLPSEILIIPLINALQSSGGLFNIRAYGPGTHLFVSRYSTKLGLQVIWKHGCSSPNHI